MKHLVQWRIRPQRDNEVHKFLQKSDLNWSTYYIAQSEGEALKMIHHKNAQDRIFQYRYACSP